jgi:hypothetical protein
MLYAALVEDIIQANRTTPKRTTTVDDVLTAFRDRRIERRDAVEALKLLDEEKNLGKFVIGRRGAPTRFEWRETSVIVTPPPASSSDARFGPRPVDPKPTNNIDSEMAMKVVEKFKSLTPDQMVIANNEMQQVFKSKSFAVSEVNRLQSLGFAVDVTEFELLLLKSSKVNTGGP